MKTIAFVTLALALLTGCGAEWDQQKKEGLIARKYMVRNVKVISAFSGNVIREFTSKSYISDISEPGNVTVTYFDKNGDLQKLDVIGEFAIVVTDTGVNTEGGAK